MTTVFKPSKRTLKTSPSPIRSLAPLARAASERGILIHPLNIGDPDVMCPPSFFEGLSSYGKQLVGYEEARGSKSLRELWALHMNSRWNSTLSPDDILVTTGSSEGLQFLFLAALDPGDEVICFDPLYANYLGIAQSIGVEFRSLIRNQEDSFKLPSVKQIKLAITDKTKAILILNADNPTGSSSTSQEVGEILKLCEKHSLLLIVDEVYREFVYTDEKPFSALGEFKDNPLLVVIDSTSKRFGLCGARVGFISSKNKNLIDNLTKLASLRLSAPKIEQFAISYMLENLAPDYIDNVVKIFRSRAEALTTSLARELPDSQFFTAGAFYGICKLPIADSEDFAKFLLTDFTSDGESVFITPLKRFFINEGYGASQVRLAYVISEERLTRSAKILSEAIAAYRQLRAE